jgi:hypothetical protein
MFRALIFDSSVDAGTPSFAAAPKGFGHSYFAFGQDGVDGLAALGGTNRDKGERIVLERSGRGAAGARNAACYRVPKSYWIDLNN